MIKARVSGLQNLLANLQRRQAQAWAANGHGSEVVYTAPYAVYVHEDLTARHPRGGQAKYLEQPARRLATSGEYRRIIRAALAAGRTPQEAFRLCGVRLLAESQPLVPVDTGVLKSSGRVRMV